MLGGTATQAFSQYPYATGSDKLFWDVDGTGDVVVITWPHRLAVAAALGVHRFPGVPAGMLARGLRAAIVCRASDQRHAYE